jgi:hypothetical protein
MLCRCCPSAGKVTIREWLGYTSPTEQDIYRKGDTHADMMQKCRLWDLEQENVRAKDKLPVADFLVVALHDYQPSMADEELATRNVRIKQEGTERAVKTAAIVAGTAAPVALMNIAMSSDATFVTIPSTTPNGIACQKGNTVVEGEVNMTDTEEDAYVILHGTKPGTDAQAKLRDSGIYVHDDDVAVQVTTPQIKVSNDIDPEDVREIDLFKGLIRANRAAGLKDDNEEDMTTDAGFESDDNPVNVKHNVFFDNQRGSDGSASSNPNLKNDDVPEPPLDPVQLFEKANIKQKAVFDHNMQQTRSTSPGAEFVGMTGYSEQPDISYDRNDTLDRGKELTGNLDNEDRQVQMAPFESMRSIARSAGAQSQDELTSHQAQKVNEGDSPAHEDENSERMSGIQANSLSSIQLAPNDASGPLQDAMASSSKENSFGNDVDLVRGWVVHADSDSNPSGYHSSRKDNDDKGTLEVPVLSWDNQSLAYKLGLLTVEDIIAQQNLQVARLPETRRIELIKSFLKSNLEVFWKYQYKYEFGLDVDGSKITYTTVASRSQGP